MSQLYGANLYFNSKDTIAKVTNDYLDKIKNMGIKYLLLCPVITSDLITESIRLRGYTLDDIEKITKLVKDKGFQYGVKFHINTTQNYNTFGSKPPKDEDTWFKKYFDLVKKVLTKMYPENIDMICIVNEAKALTRTDKYRDYFVNMKNELKELYPNMKYSQAGEGGEYTNYLCPIWDIFDILCENSYCGSQAYYTDLDCPSVKQMENVIYNDNFKFEKACYYYKKQIFITEFGCLPYDGWFKYPYAWDRGNKVYNEDVQYNYYKAYLNCRMNYPFIGGLFMWSLTDTFGCQGRKAEQIFIEKWGGNDGKTNN